MPCKGQTACWEAVNSLAHNWQEGFCPWQVEAGTLPECAAVGAGIWRCLQTIPGVGKADADSSVYAASYRVEEA